MSPTRRDFIKGFGIALGALMMARCVTPGSGQNRSTPSPAETARDRLRSCWMSFGWLAEQAQDWSDHEKGERAREALISDHRAALDELVAAGELQAAAANHAQVAFAAAAYHTWRANCGATCYEPVWVDYTPTSSAQLVQQSELLAEMAAIDSLDQDTVARAQAAIERDIAFLSLTDDEVQVLYNELIEAAGDTYDLPTLDELDLEITPEMAEAARFLVEVLLEE